MHLIRSHDYLFTILRSYGLSTQLVNMIRNLYTGATALVQINGRLYGPIPIRCGVRQVCPLSTALYTLCLQPFLNLMEERLSGIFISRGNRSVSVVAYADVVIIFLTSATDFQVIEDVIRLFDKASGTRVNPIKYQALTIGRWNTFDTVLRIAYQPSVKILGVQFWSTIHRSVTATWTHLTGKYAQSYPRDLRLAHRIQYFHTY